MYISWKDILIILPASPTWLRKFKNTAFRLKPEKFMEKKTFCNKIYVHLADNTCRGPTINMVVENLAAVLHKQLGLDLGVLDSVHTVERSFRDLLV